MFARVRRAVHAREEDGASAVEYALLVAAIAALIIVVVFAFGGLVRDIFRNTCNDLKDNTSSSTTSDCGNGSNGG
jgi:pilus assembly protein Flp/PilA